MKTIWIVDGAYLLKAAKNHAVSLKTEDTLDYLKLKMELERMCGDEIFESYYLNSVPDPPTAAQNGFHTWIKSAAPGGPRMRVQLYRLKSFHIRCRSCNNLVSKCQCGGSLDIKVQKGVDVGIATLILKLAMQNKYERLILTAGDGDFEDAINYVKSEKDKEIWLTGFNVSLSSDLQSYADKVIWLNDLWDKIKKSVKTEADKEAEKDVDEALV